jgi:SAM-dependent methyltransferase
VGDINDQIYIQNQLSDFKGPYLEVGSKDHGNTQDIKSLFSQKEKYVGIDMEDGRRVDVVLDLSKSMAEIDGKLGKLRFGTIFCLSVLEHCEDPFLIANNLTNLLKPGGQICLSVPFSLGFHGYPSDYWRFTHEGIKKIFPKLSFDLDRAVAATTRKNDFKKIDKNIGRIPFSSKYYFQRGYLFRGISAKLLKILSRIGFLRWLVGYKYVMPPTHIYMIGNLNLRKEN